MVRLFLPLLLLLCWTPAASAAAESRTDLASVRFHTEVSSTTVWEREQIIIRAEATTPDRFATLITDTPRVAGFEVYSIAHTREQLADGNHALRTGWILFALQPGMHSVSLPAVHYRLGGAIQQTYSIPALNIRVKALPPYIPPTIPVGKVSIHSRMEPEKLLKTGHLSYWHITLQGASVPPVWLPPILRQIKTSSDAQFLSASSERTTSPGIQGIYGKVVHHIPLKPQVNGRIALPAIRFQYFDPGSGRIETVQHLPEQVISLGTVARILLTGLVLAISFIILRQLFLLQNARIMQKRARNAALLHVSQAQDASELRQALRHYAITEGWPENLTLDRWLSLYNQRYAGDGALASAIDMLSRTSFGQADNHNMSDIRDHLVNALTITRKNRRPPESLDMDQWAPETLFPARNHCSEKKY